MIEDLDTKAEQVITGCIGTEESSPVREGVVPAYCPPGSGPHEAYCFEGGVQERLYGF